MRKGVPLVFGLVASSIATTHSPLESRLSNWTIGQTVQTDSGLVIGHAAPNATDVSEYLGIPYAQPPIGNLRFAAPLRYTSNTTRDASTFGAACLIAPAKGGGGMTGNVANLTGPGTQTVVDGAEGGVKMSEDCLTLNIWTKPQTGEPGKAVMLWIYGGSFTEGWTGDPLYNGQYLADLEDVVVVSMNYRVNVFGFPGSPAATNNVGLLDQRLAVEWVRDNIASFGGDPDRITLFGQSAGAASIDFYSYAWPSDPIVKGFILESGTTQVIPPLSAIDSAAMWYNITTALNCGNASSNASTVLSCMRNANSSDILTAVASSTLLFTPTIDSTLVFNESEYISRSLSGSFIQTPLLIGTNDNEEAIFRVGAILTNQPQQDWGEENFVKFWCPSAARANVSVYNHVPTWRYRWFGVFENTNLTTFPNSGAYHGSEIPIIFNTPPSGKGIANNTMEELQVMSFMQGAWATFAKNPTNGLSSYQGGWPSYGPTNNTLIRLAFDPTNPSGLNLALPETYDATCPTIFAVTSAGTGSGTTTSTAASSAAIAKSGGDSMVKISLVIVTCSIIMETFGLF